MHPFSCSCYWQCETGCLYTLWYWFGPCVFKKISSDGEMITMWLSSFCHEGTKGRLDAVIRVTRLRIDMDSETRCRRIYSLLAVFLPTLCFIIKSYNHRRCFYSSVQRASMPSNHFLAFAVSCVKWTWNKDEQLLASKAISQMERRLKEKDSRTRTVALCCLSLWSPSVQSAVISISIFEWHWII